MFGVWQKNVLNVVQFGLVVVMGGEAIISLNQKRFNVLGNEKILLKFDGNLPVRFCKTLSAKSICVQNGPSPRAHPQGA